jgi:predicted DNA-binding transcriptional regulator AlpA
MANSRGRVTVAKSNGAGVLKMGGDWLGAFAETVKAARPPANAKRLREIMAATGLSRSTAQRWVVSKVEAGEWASTHAPGPSGTPELWAWPVEVLK